MQGPWGLSTPCPLGPPGTFEPWATWLMTHLDGILKYIVVWKEMMSQGISIWWALCCNCNIYNYIHVCFFFIPCKCDIHISEVSSSPSPNILASILHHYQHHHHYHKEKTHCTYNRITWNHQHHLSTIHPTPKKREDAQSMTRRGLKEDQYLERICSFNVHPQAISPIGSMAYLPQHVVVF